MQNSPWALCHKTPLHCKHSYQSEDRKTSHTPQGSRLIKNDGLAKVKVWLHSMHDNGVWSSFELCFKVIVVHKPHCQKLYLLDDTCMQDNIPPWTCTLQYRQWWTPETCSLPINACSLHSSHLLFLCYTRSVADTEAAQSSNIIPQSGTQNDGACTVTRRFLLDTFKRTSFVQTCADKDAIGYRV